ncbi:MFS transporter [Nocardioides cheoyonin]|uniref:MFS transporter n=1 Tax=Nocardioides cheoyonin TaxID=3156615 RepID=UPI0032B47D19
MSDVQARGGQRFAATLVAGCLGVFVAQVAYSLPAAVIGTIQTTYNTSSSQLTWVPASFAAAMVIFELTFGVLGDLFGRKQLLLGGLALVAVGQVISYYSGTNVHTLWTGQAIAGVGAGALYPMSLTLIAAAAPDERVRARAIALWAGFLSVGAAVSPIVAGTLATNGHWRVSFWLVVVAAVVALLASLPAVNSSAPQGRRLDIPGQVTLVVGLLALIWALTQGSTEGYGSGKIIVGFIVAAVFLVAFVAIETRTASPLVHLTLFRNRAFAVTGLVAVVGMFGYLGATFTMPIFIGSVLHVSPVKVGILFLFVQLPALALFPLVARLIHSVSPQMVLAAGFAVMGAGAVYAAIQTRPTAAWTDYIVPMLLVGIGFCFTVGSITAVAINTVPLRLAGMASATINLLRDFGFALGPVIIGAIATPIANNRLSDGLGAAIGSAGLTNPAAAGTVTGISKEGGAIAINSLPVIPGAPGAAPLGQMPASVHELALSSLAHAYTVGFVVVAVAMFGSAVLAAVGLAGVRAVSPVEPSAEVMFEVSGVAQSVEG